MTASEAGKNLFLLIEQVNDDRAPVEITSRRGDAVLISREDYEALEETAHLLRAPANARRLLESLAQAQRGPISPLAAQRGRGGPWPPLPRRRFGGYAAP
ncbi:type II toxin-antitoxin system Phd/YefM family antitoxin [Marinactinospora rubrisoli]|uniref:Antitoxin n=1 Tax=Marinactinospora rubrisoli TaxID=2715399 RepID=A0ABW2K9U4_9ACTN